MLEIIKFLCFFFSLCLVGTRNSWEVGGCRARHVAPVYDL